MKKFIAMVFVGVAAVAALSYSSKVSAGTTAASAPPKLVVTDEMVDAKIDARLHQLLTAQMLRHGVR
jgi:hypothetical protein